MYVALLVVTLSMVQPASAAWPTDPLVNVPVCTADGDQYRQTIVTDGGRGAIVTWQDTRAIGAGAYAQHLLAGGGVDPAWTANGVALSTAATVTFVVITSDSAGGAIAAWEDWRSTDSTDIDIYCQHILSSGAVDPAWPVNGRAVCTAIGRQARPRIVADGAGGAIVTWYDYRGNPNITADIYAQHVLASGAIAPGWPADGLAICTATGTQVSPIICSDGAGGAIVAWGDQRSGSDLDVYAQHVLQSGSVDAAWPVNGLAVCTAPNNQGTSAIISDGAGGAIMAWNDFRGGTDFDIYAQHVLAGGTVDSAWPNNGLGVSIEPGDQGGAALAPDGAGGAVVTWYDYRSGTRWDVYAQHVLASGTIDSAWLADGLVVCDVAIEQPIPSIAADPAGGAVITWNDYRSGTAYNVYAQHVQANGTVDPAWPANGSAVCTNPGGQALPTIAADGAGGGIIAWTDLRDGTYNVYAQRILGIGVLGGDTTRPVIHVFAPTGGDTLVNGVADTLRWSAVDDEPLPFVDIYLSRNGGSGPWESLASHAPNTGSYIWIPSGPATNQARLLVAATDPSGNTAADTSQADFVTPTLMQFMTADEVPGGIAIQWRFGDPNAYRSVGVERAESEAGPFGRVTAPVVANVEGMSVLDTDVADGHTYWYRIVALDSQGRSITFGPITAALRPVVSEFALQRISPNPTHGTLQIDFALPRSTRARITVLDLAGREVAILTDASYAAGRHRLSWSGETDHGRVAGGIYFVRIRAGGKSLTQRVAIVH
jgi:Secretion system C-terminal sorting domain